MIRLIAAIDRERGLAKNGVMPWHIPEDERYFTEQTKTHGGHVLSGAATFRLSYRSKPLKDRQNYILTHDHTPIEGVVLVHNLSAFLEGFKDKDLWVAGGGAVFKEVMDAGKADELYLTHIDGEFGCDRFFPEYEDTFQKLRESEVREQNGYRFTYAVYGRREPQTPVAE
jgi:dihydrofolate reductase